MGFTVEDGKGRGFQASVSESNRMNVSAKTNPRIFYTSRDSGQAFMLTSVDAGPTAADYICYLKNTSKTQNLFIDEIRFSSQAVSVWKIWSVTGTAAGGTALTPSNLNLASGNTALATARGDGAVSGLTADSLLGAIRTLASNTEKMDYQDSLLMGPNDAIAIEYDTGSASSAEVSILFHYEDVARQN